MPIVEGRVLHGCASLVRQNRRAARMDQRVFRGGTRDGSIRAGREAQRTRRVDGDQGEIMRRRAITHRIPDLDAIASIAASGVEPSDVLLLPMGATEIPQEWMDAVVLDHPLANAKVRHGSQFRSTLGSLPESAHWDPRVVAAVERSVGAAGVEPQFSLQEICDAIRTALVLDGYSTRPLDVEALRVGGLVMRGLNENRRQLRDTLDVIDGMSTIRLSGFRLAVLPEGRKLYQVAKMLTDRGVACSAYSFNGSLGIQRHEGLHSPDLKRLEPALPGWSVRQYIACWGSGLSSAPRPPAGTPQNQAELVELVCETFGEGGNR